MLADPCSLPHASDGEAPTNRQRGLLATSRPDCPRRMTFLRTCVQTSSATARRAPLSGVFLSQPSPVTPHGQVSAWPCRHLANVPWPYARPTPSHDYRAAIRTSCGSIERVRSPGGRAMQVPRPAKRMWPLSCTRKKRCFFTNTKNPEKVHKGPFSGSMGQASKHTYHPLRPPFPTLLATGVFDCACLGTCVVSTN